MFPDKRRRPTAPPHIQFTRPVRRQTPRRSSTALPNLISRFRNQEGQFDLSKISETAAQLNQLYTEVSPMISKIKGSIRK